MAEVTAANSQTVLDSLSINRSQQGAQSNTKTLGNDPELGQQTFLKLMIAQLNNQDPLSPQENGEFIAQLAQFSSVEGIGNLNTKLEGLNNSLSESLKVQNSTLTGINGINSNISGLSNSYLSNQALQASSLVGRPVTVATDNTLFIQGDVVNGSMNLSQYSPDVSLHIYDTESQKRIDSIPLGALKSGENVFRWNGKNLELNGNVVDFDSDIADIAASGRYKFVAEAVINGKSQALPMSLSANVNSVTVGANGQLILNLSGLGAVPLSAVKQLG